MNLLEHIAYITAAYFVIVLPLAGFLGRWARGTVAVSERPAPGEDQAGQITPLGSDPSPAPGHRRIVRDWRWIVDDCACEEFRDNLQQRSRWKPCPEHTGDWDAAAARELAP